MNIALFLDCWSPMKNGVITSAQQLKEGLEKKGHHVVIVTVQVEGYKSDDPNVMLIPLLPFDFGSKQGFGPALVHQGSVNRFLKDHKVELIHVHTEFTLGYAGRNAALQLKLPRVSTTHTMWEQYTNYMFLLKFKSLVRAFLKHYLKGTSVIVAPSIKAKKYYQKNVVPHAAFQLIPNGIDMQKFKQHHITDQDIADLRKHYGFTAEDHLLIFVGRIGPEKRVEELFKAVIPVLKKYSHVKIVFVGDGPSHAALVDSAASEGVSEKVVFTGFVDWTEVYKLYSIANMFVTASLSEVHPMTLIEGAMCGLPSIARRDDSYLDLIRPGQNGYLCDTDEEMTVRIDELLSDEGKLKVYSKNAYEISQIFTADNHVAKMEKLYKKVIECYPNKLEQLKDETILS